MKIRRFFEGTRDVLNQRLLGQKRPRPKPLAGWIAIEPLETRYVLSGVETFTDGDGDVYTVKLTGPGTFDIVQHADGSIESISLHDTTLKSSLSIKVKTPRNGAGDGEVNIGEITGMQLKSISAPKSDLTGAGISLGAPLLSLTLDDVLNGADIMLGGTGGKSMKVKLGELGNASDVMSASAISSLDAQLIGDGKITAPAIGKLSTKAGGLGADLQVADAIKQVVVKGGDADGNWMAATIGKVSVTFGDFRASIFATASADSLGKKPAIGNVTVAGGNFSGDLRAFGPAGSITVNAKKNAAKQLVGGMMVGATLTAKDFGKVTVKGDFLQTTLLAGADLGDDGMLGGSGAAADVFGPGNIASFKVGGTVGSASVVGAGLGSVDEVFRNPDDFIAPGNPPRPSKIGKFAVGDAMADSYFRAGTFPKKVLIHKEKVDPLTDPRFAPVPDTTAPTIMIALASDTGISSSDTISSNPTIVGTIVEDGSVAQFRAGLDGMATADFVDVLSTLGAGGQFTFSALLLELINGGSLPDGRHTLHVFAVDASGNASGQVDYIFTLDTTAPGFSLTPTDRTEDVLPRELVFATFDEAVFIGMETELGYVADTTGSFILTIAGQPIAGRLVLDRGGTRLTFVPDSDLPGNVEITATLETSMVFDVAGNGALAVPAKAQFRTVNTLGIPGTTVVGYVFDSAKDSMGQNVPLANATIHVANAPNIQAVTDANGRFELSNTPAGKLMIDVDGSTIAVAMGTFYPTVAELINAVPGQVNIFSSPIFLPLAQTNDFVTVDNSPGGMTMVSNAGLLPGWQLMVPAGSVERRDGTMANSLLIAPVPPDRLPAPLPDGMSPAIVITVQTEGGADVFNQPVPLTAPNYEGLPPGAKTTLWDFDHARGIFVPVATATVSDDGQTVTTDPGQGVLRPGWHFIQSLVSITTNIKNGKDPKPNLPLGELLGDLGIILLDVLALGGDIPFPLPLPVLIIGTIAGTIRSGIDGNTASTLGSLQMGLASNFELPAVGKALAMEASMVYQQASSEAGKAISAIESMGLLNGQVLSEQRIQFSKDFARQAQATANLGKLARYSAIGLNIFGLINDIPRLLDDINKLRMKIEDPPGDTASQILGTLGTMTNQIESYYLESLHAAKDIFGSISIALDVYAKSSDENASTPISGALKAELSSKMGMVETLANSVAQGIARMTGEIGEIKKISEKLESLAAPPSGTVFYKFTGSGGATLTGTGFGAVSISIPFDSSGILTVVDPVARAIGSKVITAPSLTSGIFSLTGSPLILEPSKAADGDGNGLPDDIDAIISSPAPSRAYVQDLLQGVDPVAAGLSISGTIARIQTLGSASLVAANNDYAFIATTAPLVQVIDVSRPATPFSPTRFGIGGQASDMDLRGGHLAIGEANGKVQVYDVENPLSPALFFETTAAAGQVSVGLGTNHLVFNDGTTLRSYDLGASIQSDSFVLPGTGVVQDVHVTEDTVYAVRSDAGAHTVTVISASLGADGTLTFLDSLVIANASAAFRATLAGSDGVLFVGDIVPEGQSSAGYATVSINSPDNLQLIAAAQAIGAGAIEVTGSGQALAIGGNPGSPALLLLDVSDPSDTNNIVTTIPLFAPSPAVAIAGGLAFVASSGSTMDVLRFVQPDSGTVSPAVTLSAAVQGGAVYEGQSNSIHIGASDDSQVARVELVFQGDNILAVDTSYPFDLDFVPPVGLPDGQTITLMARAFDTGGNMMASAPVNYTYHAIPPHAIGATPAPGSSTQLAVTTISVQFDKPVSRTSVLPEDFTLTNAGGDGAFGTIDDFSVPVDGLRFGTDGKQLTALFNTPLNVGKYRFTISSSKLTDMGGNMLDGEFNGTFPSGNGSFGGDFSYEFDVAGRISSIFPGPTYGVGTFPLAIASGDLDGDGHLDIAVPNGFDGNVGILFGRGDGSFAPVETLTGLPGATAIGVADLDGDGDAELLVGFIPSGTGMLAYYKSNGDGTFSDPVITQMASLGGNDNILFADVNNDSRLDVIVPGSPTVLMLNDGSGNLGTPTPIADLNGSGIATGDVNNDGKVDIFAGRNGGISSVVLGNGNGTFGAPIPLDTFSSLLANAAQLVDVTGDGKRDLVYTSGTLIGGTLNVRPGNGDGTFGALTSIQANNNTTLSIVDLNGDAFLDVISTGGTTGLSVFFGSATGFAAAVDYSVPVSAFDAVIGDWDLDGNVDIAVTSLSDSVALIFGTGNGSFSTPSRPAYVARSPLDGAVGDVNGDGKLDVVTADTNYDSHTSHTVTVYLGNGSHGFLRAQTFEAGAAAYAVALGDLNGDGKLDIVTANTDDDTVSVLLGAGDGTYGAPVRIAVKDRPDTLLIADITGDTKPDIVVNGGSSGSIAGYVSILPGVGDGTFGARTDIESSDPVDVVLAVDLNGDNVPDLATGFVSSFSPNSGVTIRLNNGSGTFGAPNKLTLPLLTAAALFDVNNDNKADLITGDLESDLKNVAVRLGNGDGTFAAVPTVTQVAIEPADFFAEDFTRDGIKDIIVSSRFSSPQIMKANGDGTYTAGTAINLSGDVYGVGNFGVDSDPDLINSGVSIFSGNGNGTFMNAATLAAGGQPTAVELGDLNNDGKLDVVTANQYGNSISVLLGTNDGRFDFPIDYPVGRSPSDLKLADLNGDGRLDVLTVNTLSGDVSILLALPGGGFAPSVSVGLGMFASSPKAIVVGDVNHDDKVDFVTANGGGNVSVLLGNGNGTFGAASVYGVGGGQQGLSIGDIDGDGDLDLASAQMGSPARVSILKNDGNGVFSVFTALNEDSFVNRAVFGDVDGDGDLDIAIARQESVSVRLNNGDGTFASPNTFTADGFIPTAIIFGDVTRDGRMDIVTTNAMLRSFAVLVNTGGGMFDAPLFYGTIGSGDVAVGLINGDNKLDVLIVDGFSTILTSLNVT